MSFLSKLNIAVNPIGAGGAHVANNLLNNLNLERKDVQEKESLKILEIYKKLKDNRNSNNGKLLFTTAILAFTYAKDYQLNSKGKYSKKNNIDLVTKKLFDISRKYSKNNIASFTLVLFITDTVRVYENSGFYGSFLEKQSTNLIEKSLELSQGKFIIDIKETLALEKKDVVFSDTELMEIDVIELMYDSMLEYGAL